MEIEEAYKDIYVRVTSGGTDPLVVWAHLPPENARRLEIAYTKTLWSDKEKKHKVILNMIKIMKAGREVPYALLSKCNELELKIKDLEEILDTIQAKVYENITGEKLEPIERKYFIYQLGKPDENRGQG
jgi:hypothetical protein